MREAEFDEVRSRDGSPTNILGVSDRSTSILLLEKNYNHSWSYFSLFMSMNFLNGWWTPPPLFPHGGRGIFSVVVPWRSGGMGNLKILSFYVGEQEKSGLPSWSRLESVDPFWSYVNLRIYFGPSGHNRLHGLWINCAKKLIRQ